MLDRPIIAATIATAIFVAFCGYLALTAVACTFVQSLYGTEWSLVAFAGFMSAIIFGIVYVRARFE